MPEAGSVISVVVPQRPGVAKLVRVAGLAQNPNKTFGDALPLFEFLILVRLRFSMCLGWLLRPSFPTAPHYTASKSNANRLPTLAARVLWNRTRTRDGQRRPATHKITTDHSTFGFIRSAIPAPLCVIGHSTLGQSK